MTNIERATLDPRSQAALVSAFIQASSDLTRAVIGALSRQDGEAADAVWDTFGRGGALELRLEARPSGLRVMLQVSPPGGDPVRVFDLPLPDTAGGPPYGMH